MSLSAPGEPAAQLLTKLPPRCPVWTGSGSLGFTTSVAREQVISVWFSGSMAFSGAEASLRRLPSFDSAPTPALFEEENEEIGGGAEGGQGKRKRLFSKELRCMMYGFGDDQNPYTESVDILEDLVIEFITEMTHKAMSIGRQGRVQVEDIVFLIRKDPRKFARVKDLLTMNEELKRARKAFDEANYGS
ncbi:PREDICTED: transcription initiation factor TFIID subunit 13 isoform X1 [Myotis davidii]|uniref:transcription initiation factor TFIID subunit 13 isoform X1 n=1 Tax=Myotis davidii TaxID=225400 RepID=UPI0007678F4A|nr:PREDICTED: transcription initiation factor TFIID subunit 13 isoform X1 [Myotis davidii]